MTKNQKEKIEIIADHYGIEKQLGKTLEELKELTVEVKTIEIYSFQEMTILQQNELLTK